MKRYRDDTFPWDDDEYVVLPELNVHDEDVLLYDGEEVEHTGILDADGRQILRVIEKIPFGFHVNHTEEDTD